MRARSPQARKLMESYGPWIRPHANLFYSVGDWERSPLRRKMVVMKLASGSLVVHNPFELHEDELGDLEAEGSVRAILVPNSLHDSDAAWFARRFPKAELFVPRSLLDAYRRDFWSRLRCWESQWPVDLSAEIACVPIRGTRLDEAAFVHLPTRTLVAADFVFYFPEAKKILGWDRLLMRINGAVGPLGPTRFFRWALTTDRDELARSIADLLLYQFDRVIPAHGDVLEAGGNAAVARAFAYLPRPLT